MNTSRRADRSTLADTRTSEEVRRRVTAASVTLDPVRLLQPIRVVQQELADIADRPTATETAAPTTPALEQFLAGLRTAWRDSEVRRPTNRPKQKAPRADVTTPVERLAA